MQLASNGPHVSEDQVISNSMLHPDPQRAAPSPSCRSSEARWGGKPVPTRRHVMGNRVRLRDPKTELGDDRTDLAHPAVRRFAPGSLQPIREIAHSPNDLAQGMPGAAGPLTWQCGRTGIRRNFLLGLTAGNPVGLRRGKKNNNNETGSYVEKTIFGGPACGMFAGGFRSALKPQ